MIPRPNTSPESPQGWEQTPLGAFSLVNIPPRVDAILEREVNTFCPYCGEGNYMEGNTGYCDGCGEFIDLLSPISEQKDENPNIYTFPKSILLSAKYQCKGELPGDICIIGYEDHGTYLVALIEISHHFPGHTYRHKGRKMGPSGKRDGELTQVQKTSPGKIERKNYRIEFTKDIQRDPIYMHQGKVRNGTPVSADKKFLIGILTEAYTIINNTLA